MLWLQSPRHVFSILVLSDKVCLSEGNFIFASVVALSQGQVEAPT